MTPFEVGVDSANGGPSSRSYVAWGSACAMASMMIRLKFCRGIGVAFGACCARSMFEIVDRSVEVRVSVGGS